MKTTLAIAFVLLSSRAYSEEFIVGVDSQRSETVKLTIGLELTSDTLRCPSFVIRNYIPVPGPTIKVLRQEQSITSTIADYTFQYESGFCQYKPTAVYYNAIIEKKSGSGVIRTLENGEESDVDLLVKDLSHASSTVWRKWREVAKVPNVYINIK